MHVVDAFELVLHGLDLGMLCFQVLVETVALADKLEKEIGI